MSVMMKNVYDDDLTGCSESRTVGAQSVLNTSRLMRLLTLEFADWSLVQSCEQAFTAALELSECILVQHCSALPGVHSASFIDCPQCYGRTL